MCRDSVMACVMACVSATAGVLATAMACVLAMTIVGAATRADETVSVEMIEAMMDRDGTIWSDPMRLETMDGLEEGSRAASLHSPCWNP